MGVIPQLALRSDVYPTWTSCRDERSLTVSGVKNCPFGEAVVPTLGRQFTATRPSETGLFAFLHRPTLADLAGSKLSSVRFNS